jgi:hypothetical protein
MLCHTSLHDYYKMVFAMAQHHKYSITEIENMLPYERDLYFGMIVDFIAKQNENT